MKLHFADFAAVVAVLVSSAMLTTSTARADAPSSEYIFPPGGQRGTAVEFRVGAYYLHGGSPFEIRGRGLEAGSRIAETKTTWFEGPMIFKPASQAGETYPKDHLGNVRIAADTEPGVYYWRLWTSQGAVAGRPFIVGTLPEVVEQEVDGRPLPVDVELPVTVNGRMFPREDVDIWQFEARQGESLVCEVHAARIGSPLDSRLEVRGPSGQVVAENTDHFGADSFLRFTAPVTGRYRVRIHDSSYRGLQSYIYRLTITNEIYVERVFPLGGRAGREVEFQLLGQHVPGNRIKVKLPERPGEHRLYLPLGTQRSNPVTVAVDDVDEHLESKDGPPPSPITVPAVLNGRIAAAGEVDRWTIAARKGDKLQFELATARFGSPLDAVLTVTSADGKKLAAAASTPQQPIEPSVTLTVPADGRYQVEVRDMIENRGGLQYAYRLAIKRPPAPGFKLRLPADAVTIGRGGELKWKITADRTGGFKDPIEVDIEGLPDDVQFTPALIPAGKKDVQLVLKAAAQAKIRATHVHVRGRAKPLPPKPAKQDKSAKKEQAASTDTDEPPPGPWQRATIAGLPGSADRDDVLLAVAMPTPFKLDGRAFQTNYAARGTRHTRHYKIDRGGYSGPLTLKLADRQIRHQQGVVGTTMVVPSGVTEVDYAVRLPTWLEMNRTSRTVVMAVGEVEDEDGVKHKVSFSSSNVKDQIIILTAPCPLSVRAGVGSVAADSGPVKVPVKVARGVLARAKVMVELVLPEHFRGVTCQPIEIPGNADQGTLTIEFRRPLGSFNMPATIRATTATAKGDVVAETPLDLVDVNAGS